MNIDSLVDLTQETLANYDVDFGLLSISEDDTIKLIANGVLDLYNEIQVQDPLEREAVLLSAIVALIVESFVLNTQKLKGTE